ncbi:hypothetical protein TNCV_970921 [Trichonephila clavipes]|nr:hypothetical protein TNCV_970921 [Trichonephila clavipes]
MIVSNSNPTKALSQENSGPIMHGTPLRREEPPYSAYGYKTSCYFCLGASPEQILIIRKPGQRLQTTFLWSRHTGSAPRVMVWGSAGLFFGCLKRVPRGSDKSDLTRISLNSPVPKGPVDLLRPEPEMSLNRNWSGE